MSLIVLIEVLFVVLQVLWDWVECEWLGWVMCIVQLCIDVFVDVIGDYNWIYVDLVWVQIGLLGGKIIVYGFLLFLLIVEDDVVVLMGFFGIVYVFNYGLNMVCFFVLVLSGVEVWVWLWLVLLEVCQFGQWLLIQQKVVEVMFGGVVVLVVEQLLLIVVVFQW